MPQRGESTACPVPACRAARPRRRERRSTAPARCDSSLPTQSTTVGDAAGQLLADHHRRRCATARARPARRARHAAPSSRAIAAARDASRWRRSCGRAPRWRSAAMLSSPSVPAPMTATSPGQDRRGRVHRACGRLDDHGVLVGQVVGHGYELRLVRHERGATIRRRSTRRTPSAAPVRDDRTRSARTGWVGRPAPRRTPDRCRARRR